MWKKVSAIGRQSPETHPRRSDSASFSTSSSWMAGGCQLISQCLDLGWDSVIPSPWSVHRAGGKAQRRGGGIDFQREGMRRIELRCVAETGFERNILLAGKQMSVAYSGGAMQFELEQVLLMLINCIAVFHHSFPGLPPPLSSAQLSP